MEEDLGAHSGSDTARDFKAQVLVLMALIQIGLQQAKSFLSSMYGSWVLIKHSLNIIEFLHTMGYS